MQIGNYLKEHRKSRHFTQEQVASKLNISRQAISAWENDTSFPDLENLVLLSQIYETSVDSLIGNTVPVHPADVKNDASVFPIDSSFSKTISSQKVSPESSVPMSEDAFNSKLESIFLIVLAIAAFELPFLGVFLLIYLIKTLKSRVYFKGIILLICVACIIHDLIYYAQFFS